MKTKLVSRFLTFSGFMFLSGFSMLLFPVVNEAFGSEQDVYLSLTTREIAVMSIGVEGFTCENCPRGTALADSMGEIIRGDLEYSLRVDLVRFPVSGDPGIDSLLNSTEPDEGEEERRRGVWMALGTNVLVIGGMAEIPVRGFISRLFSGSAGDGKSLAEKGKNECLFHFKVMHLFSMTEIFEGSLPVDESNLRDSAHMVSDRILREITGRAGIARTKIAFSRPSGDGGKEIVLADYDGFDPGTVIPGGTINIIPAWRPGNRELLFTSFRAGNADLYRFVLKDKTIKPFSLGSGLDTGGAWSPDGNWIAYTKGVAGNPDVYVYSILKKRAYRLTRHRGIDDSPSWSPNSRELAFVSDRHGRPQIYIMDRSGANIRRFTYKFRQCFSPAWSPEGNFLAFVARVDGVFKVYCADIAGESFYLLAGEGVSNEDPSWSPDGLHLVFSSNHDGANSIYTVHRDGTGLRKITPSDGSASPAWSTY